MVEHPVAYPWSSYHFNGGNKNITLIKPHAIYLALGNTEAGKKISLPRFFSSRLSDYTIQTILNTTNKPWVLGDERFIKQISKALPRRAKPLPQGGDRRSEAFKASLKINDITIQQT